ncbi:hypothetical protein [Halobacillus karajensis]|nr:hypothetical protein [Halobacillus karajensis]CDQ19164.1 hypothetical protein BN982_01449 [Halobacillus karajensis]CDQ22762.1 hypothetical protein BN983_00977 [Halobacillus karajensis]CDQ26244.1 hypothetical protein BN981_00457 [Halobacillus karajensis]
MFPSNKNNEESKSVFDYVGGGLKKSVDVVKDKWPTPNSKISQ